VTAPTWMAEQFLSLFVFCPRCRRLVYVQPDGAVRDPTPRERPPAYAMLRTLFPGGTPRRDCFGLRRQWGHDCGAPVVSDPEAPPADRWHEVYDRLPVEAATV
jgi:hypothetical protein